ncbi:hypothetical protein TWF696_000252 [Orbilia brochopaga]|uniref:Uncharacterized protein n=1 Tax=Orbilia brochopaga TaxID=3140254 RepID=A0AAV9VAP9_9PEZI
MSLFPTNSPPFTIEPNHEALSNLTDEQREFQLFMHERFVESRGDIVAYRQQAMDFQRLATRVRSTLWGADAPSEMPGAQIRSIGLKLLRHAQSLPFRKTVHNVMTGGGYSYGKQREVTRVFVESMYHNILYFKVTWTALMHLGKSLNTLREYQERIEESIQQMDLRLRARHRVFDHLQVAHEAEFRNLVSVYTETKMNLQKYGGAFEELYAPAAGTWAALVFETIAQLNRALEGDLPIAPWIPAPDLRALLDLEMGVAHQRFKTLGELMHVIYVRNGAAVGPEADPHNGGSGSSAGVAGQSGPILSRMQEVEAEILLFASQLVDGTLDESIARGLNHLDFNRDPAAAP